MKKIIYIGGFELPDKNAAAQRVTSNAKIFNTLGYEVTLIGLDKEITKADGLVNIEQISDEITAKSISYPANKKEWLNALLGRKEVFEYLLSNIDNIEMVILYNYPALASYRIKRMLKSIGIKVVSDITEWYNPKGSGLLFAILKWLDTNARIQLIALMGNGVITTSQYMTDYYNRKGKTVLELPTLYDTKVFDKPSREFRTGDIKKLIYVGSPFDVDRASSDRSTVKERLDKVIISLESLSNKYKFVFDVYGVTKENYLKVYPEHDFILNTMSDKITFHGRKTHEYVLKKISESDFSIFFRDESLVNLAGFPSKLAESISIGVPVITNSIFSLKKYGNVKGVFLSEIGAEEELIESCFEISEHEILNIKGCTYDSHHFDYRNYAINTSEFINII